MNLKGDLATGADEHPKLGPAEVDSELLRRLAGCLAHHVNNALTGVIGNLELSMRALSPSGPVSDHLQTSLNCAMQAAAAVKRIVTFVTYPEAIPARQPLSLAILVDQVVERLRVQMRSNLTIETSCSSAGWVLASETALLSALQQVIDNAVEAMPAGGTLRFQVEERHGWCQLIVTDTGGGLPAEILPHMFEPFHTTKALAHMGLGLVQCRDLMRLLGGRVEVASAAGKGTTVWLALPALATADRTAHGSGDGGAKSASADAYEPEYCGI